LSDKFNQLLCLLLNYVADASLEEERRADNVRTKQDKCIAWPKINNKMMMQMEGKI